MVAELGARGRESEVSRGIALTAGDYALEELPRLLASFDAPDLDQAVAALDDEVKAVEEAALDGRL